MMRDVSIDRKVDIRRFAVLVDAYGAGPSHWPEDERHGAMLLLDKSADAKQMRDDALALDLWLDDAPLIEPTAALFRRVLSSVPVRRSWPERLFCLAQAIWPFGPTWQPAATLVAAAVLGVAFGFTDFDEAEGGIEAGVVIAEEVLSTGDLEGYWNEQ